MVGKEGAYTKRLKRENLANLIEWMAPKCITFRILKKIMEGMAEPPLNNL